MRKPELKRITAALRDLTSVRVKRGQTRYLRDVMVGPAVITSSNLTPGQSG